MHHSSRNICILSFCTLLAALLLSSSVFAQPGDWETVQGFSGIPGERHENGFLQVGDKFILIGGRNSEWKLTEHYDFTTNAWAQGSFHPLRMHHIQAVEIDGLVYVVGAMTGDFPDEVAIPNIYIYDPLTAAWYVGPEIPLARRRGSCGVVVHNKKIYMFSGLTDGHNGGHVAFTDVYDPYSNTLSTLADAPRARDHFNATLIGDQVYCVGGRRSKHDTDGLNSDMETLVDVYDILTDTWTTLAAPLPVPRAGAATAAIGDQLFVIGGENANGATDTTHVLDIVSKTWVAGWDTLGDERHGTQAIMNNGMIYIAAGSKSNAIEIIPTDTTFIERFSPTGVFGSPVGSPYTQGALTAPTGLYDFGSTIMGTTASYVLTLTNTSANQAILLTDLNISGNDSTLFTASVAGTIPMAIPPGGTLDVTLTFTPDAANAKSGTFTYTHSGSNGPQTINLLGEGCVGVAGGPNGAFIESGGTLMMQVESEIPEVDSEWAQGVDGATVYYEWTGTNHFVTPPAETIEYEFTINTPGIYRVALRSQQDDFTLPFVGNDVWMQFPDADARKVKGMFPTPTENLPLTGWFKVFQADLTGWSWYTSAEEHNDVGIYLDIPAAGTYHLLLAGRSTAFKADKFAFYTYQQELTDAELDALAESPRITTTCFKTWYADADADTYGDDSVTQIAATQPAGYVGVGGDCVDSDASINPGAVELFDGIDNDCDSEIDEGWLGTCQFIRINCGSDTSYTTGSGNVFVADTYFSGGNTSTYGDGSLAIAGTTEDGLFQTTRSTNVDLAAFNYNIPVINGPYTVVLYFGEIYFGVGTNGGGVGSRVFDVSIEGTTELTAFDILTDPQSGGASATAVIKSYSTTVFDGSLTITLDASAGANRPKISAIEIMPQAGCGTGNPFPIELLSFEAERRDEQVVLNWATASENNNDFFTIERSQDGFQFEEIQKVASLGNSQQKRAYQTIDAQPLQGANYYRLKQTDLDGQFSYSHTVLVAFYTGEVEIYPNPVHNGEAITIAFEMAERGTVSLSLNNILGQEVSKSTTTLAKGRHEQSLNIQDLRQGYYLLKLKIGNKTIVQKIAVLE